MSKYRWVWQVTPKDPASDVDTRTIRRHLLRSAQPSLAMLVATHPNLSQHIAYCYHAIPEFRDMIDRHAREFASHILQSAGFDTALFDFQPTLITENDPKLT